MTTRQLKPRTCTSGEGCLRRQELGRPTFLLDDEAVASGLCAECRRGKVISIRPENAGELILAPVQIVVDLDEVGAEEDVITAKEEAFEKLGESLASSNSSYAESVTSGERDELEKSELANARRLGLRSISDEGREILRDAMKIIIPSKDSPEPLLVAEYDEEAALDTQTHLNIALKACGMLSNSFDVKNLSWRHSLASETLAERDKFESLHPRAVKVWDNNCSSLVSDAEVKAIFGDMTSDEFCLNIARLHSFWANPGKREWSNHEILDQFVGQELLPQELRGSAASYAQAFSVLNGNAIEHSHVNLLGKMYAAHAYHLVENVYKFKTEKEAVDWFCSSPKELDDFFYSADAVAAAAAAMRSERFPANAAQEDMFAPDGAFLKMKEAAEKAIAFSDLIDRKWQEAYAKSPVDALIARFGRPVGIPKEKLTPFHFLPGGYLVESGWLSVNEDSAQPPGLRINLPVSNEGAPIAGFDGWNRMGQNITLSSPVSTNAGLAQAAEASTSAEEAWFTMYNLGLPKDSLYSGSLLSVISPTPSGQSYDRQTGTIRGMIHPLLSGIEIAMGPNANSFPRASSRISAVRSDLCSESLAPRGTISQAEFDLAQWRLQRLSDNFLGNEYGIASPAEGVKAPYNFDKLSREWSRSIQEHVLAMGEKDGVLSFSLQEQSFVRPLVGKQRGEAVAMFFANPGTHMRRTGYCASTSFEGPARAVLERVTSPYAVATAYLDPATGVVTDGIETANHLPGTLSLNPYTMLAKSSSLIDNERSQKITTKIQYAGPGKRQSGSKKFRFAAKAFGEKATASGLINPETIGETGGYNTHHVRNYFLTDIGATVTDDSPRYSKALTMAPWHTVSLFAKDHEVGEVGHTYLSLRAETDRRICLQRFMNGKHSERARLYGAGAELFTKGMMSGMKSFSNEIMYNPKLLARIAHPDEVADKETVLRFQATGQNSVGEDPRLTNYPAYGVFGYEMRGGKAEPELMPKFGLNSGIYGTGLENLAPIYEGEAPIKSAKRLKRWGEEFADKAKRGDFELEYTIGSKSGPGSGPIAEMMSRPSIRTGNAETYGLAMVHHASSEACPSAFMKTRILADSVMLARWLGREPSKAAVKEKENLPELARLLIDGDQKTAKEIKYRNLFRFPVKVRLKF